MLKSGEVWLSLAHIWPSFALLCSDLVKIDCCSPLLLHWFDRIDQSSAWAQPYSTHGDWQLMASLAFFHSIWASWVWVDPKTNPNQLVNCPNFLIYNQIPSLPIVLKMNLWASVFVFLFFLLCVCVCVCVGLIFIKMLGYLLLEVD